MDKRSSGVIYSAVSTVGDDVGNSFELESRHTAVSEIGIEVVEAAVVVRNAEKWYKVKKPVISGLNMTVPSGCIYALLGSSGCGKTSLLSCIVGLRNLNKGSVWVFGEKPGTNDVGIPGRNVGYMPQETSLYDEFTVWETLSYFGTFSGMTKEQVGTEFKVLVNLLDLPPLIRRVGTLSGGQRRRVSFAAAMIHNPQLLILDEPTVGIDPLLRQQIWAYLTKLVTRKNTTVIITTHYIEEARQANMVGVMRNGKMIAEESPQNLIHHFTTEENGPLETAVLKLCKEDAIEENENGQGQVKQRRRRNSRRRVSTWDIELDTKKRLTVQSQEVKMPTVDKESDERSLTRSWARIKALARKNIIILLRNYPLLLFVILIPSIEMIFMGIAFGYEPKHLKIGVVNQEVNNTICSNYIPPLGKCDLSHLSCSYLSHIDSDEVELERFESEQYAVNAVHSGKVWGYLIFPQNFSNDIYQSMVAGAKDEQLLSSRKIIGKFDETNKHISGTIKAALYSALSDFTSNFLSKCGINPKRKQSSLRYRSPIYGSDIKDMSVYATPSMAIGALFFFPIISIGIRYIDERQSGVLERSLVAGVRTWEISAAYLISEFFVLLTQEVFVLGVLTFIAEIKTEGSVLLVLGLFLLTGYCGVSLGFLLGSVCSEKIEVAILALAAFMPNVLLSGIFWPVQGMPEIVQDLVKLMPCTLPGESVRSIISRGWGLTHSNVWPGFVAVISHMVLYLLLTILLHKIKAKL
ncbi:unnamed protein product [Orchesella dallaii]|uniref:ABC transporter G family member 23 n=1 Tax=Orchesella dallaii TaxID=48710 RepID=A0ABP1S8C9_9HEXA